MGKPQSKSQDGNTNINIEEHLINNEVSHFGHEIKLWIILAINILQLLYIIRNILKKKWRQQGFSRARALSLDNLDSVRIEK